MSCNAYQIEKCSESTGVNFVLCLFNSFSIKSHPHIIASLFAIAIFFVYFIISTVGFRPCIPKKIIYKDCKLSRIFKRVGLVLLIMD